MVYFYRAKHLIVAILVVFISFSVVGLSVKAASTSIFRPIESTKVLNNPLMGWAPDARDTTYVQPHKLVLANIKWSELEPQKGIYNFSYIESKFNFSY